MHRLSFLLDILNEYNNMSSLTLQADNTDWSGSQHFRMGVAMGSSQGVRTHNRYAVTVVFTVPKAGLVICTDRLSD